jgi:cellulose synthase/poly-beta-1,6-N-acetylglucosamine synthase-like glycosyltransferase
MSLETFVYWSFIICITYLLSVYSAFAMGCLFSAIEGRLLVRDNQEEDYEALADSRFTIPVSVIAPAYNEAVVVVNAVQSMLALDYPEFEVIVVNDGSKDQTFDVLQKAFDLKPQEMYYRKVFSSKEIRGIYQSNLDRRLLVIDKENGGKADALNCGINFARYRYLCTVDGDTVFSRDALLKGMRLAMRDPGRVLGVTSLVETSRRPEEDMKANSGEYELDEGILTNFERLDYMRAFMNNRLGWSRLGFMLCSVGAFAIWRRDVIMELGGFSGKFTCEDIELTFRVHEHYRRGKTPYRVISLGEMVGWTEGPDTIRSLISQRSRWQRVINETVWHYRHMFLNYRYGTVGFLGMPYYVLTEVLAPFFQALSIITIPIAWWIGKLSLFQFLLFLLVVAFSNGVYSNLAILMHDKTSRGYCIRDLIYMMFYGPIDLFIYRPILFWAQTKGAIDFLRGDKEWHKFERNCRTNSIK